jgi:carboxymethylenebutenolidase
MEVVGKVPDRGVASDLDATVRWAQSTKSANIARLGITGFCWSGRQVWLYAAHNPDLSAGVPWYGPLQQPKTEASPNNPIDLIKAINAPILGLYGGADPGIPVGEIEAMRAALKENAFPAPVRRIAFTSRSSARSSQICSNS